MKFKFAKSVLLGAFFAMGSFGLTACGDDSSSNSGEEPSSSSAGEEDIVLPPVSEGETPLTDDSKVMASATSDGNGGYILTLSGSLKTDSDEFDTEGYDGEDRVYYNIDSLKFDISDKDGKKVPLNVPIKASAFGDNADRGINLSTAVDGEISLNQIGKCGDFTLYVTIYMSGDEDDTKQFQYVDRREAAFNVHCEDIVSSSAAATCTEMEKVGPVTLSNVYGDGQDKINFATGTAENYDVTMVFEDGVAFFDAAAGVDIIRERDQETGVLPEDPVCLENFAEAYNGKDNHMELEQMGWYLVKKTSGETYAVMIDHVMKADASRGDLTIIYYKKK